MKKGEIYSGDGQFVVLTGRVTDGIEITGPFSSDDDACEWAGELGEAWEVVKLNPPTN